MHEYVVTECAYAEMLSCDHTLNSKAKFSADKSSLKPTALLPQLKSNGCAFTGEGSNW